MRWRWLWYFEFDSLVAVRRQLADISAALIFWIGEYLSLNSSNFSMK